MPERVLNLFYDEADPDRWVPFDRFPRRLIRRIVRGRPRVGGQKRVFLNLCAGLDRLRVPYRVNDYGYARKHPGELACIVGKPHVLDKLDWQNPILFGAAVPSHPLDDLDLFERRPVKRVLVPGPWAEAMFKPYWDAVEAWPVGIDTERWRPSSGSEKPVDILLYNKIRWEHDRYEPRLAEPIRAALRQRGHSVMEIRYGAYREDAYEAALRKCKTMIFLCEHETQGIAYQQALSSGVPILAWDRGGPWADPAYYPHRVVYKPVTSVPYWDDRCGARFRTIEDFSSAWDEFWDAHRARAYAPRDYILEELTLEKCAGRYVDIADEMGV